MSRAAQGPFHDLHRSDEGFDTVSREGLWKLMEKFGCPSKFITIVRQLHDGMMLNGEGIG